MESTALDRIRTDILKATAKVGDISKRVPESMGIIEKRRRICGQESDGGAREQRERNVEVVG